MRGVDSEENKCVTLLENAVIGCASLVLCEIMRSRGTYIDYYICAELREQPVIHNFQLSLSVACITESQESRNKSNLLNNFSSELLF